MIRVVLLRRWDEALAMQVPRADVVAVLSGAAPVGFRDAVVLTPGRSILPAYCQVGRVAVLVGGRADEFTARLRLCLRPALIAVCRGRTVPSDALAAVSNARRRGQTVMLFGPHKGESLGLDAGMGYRIDVTDEGLRVRGLKLEGG